jgi:hypothetical protein
MLNAPVFVVGQRDRDELCEWEKVLHAEKEISDPRSAGLPLFRLVNA